jgi:hypothetical protein
MAAADPFRPSESYDITRQRVWPAQGVAVIPRHPLRRVLPQLRGVPEQFGQAGAASTKRLIAAGDVFLTAQSSRRSEFRFSAIRELSRRESWTIIRAAGGGSRAYRSCATGSAARGRLRNAAIPRESRGSPFPAAIVPAIRTGRHRCPRAARLPRSAQYRP